MSEEQKKILEQQLWNIANTLRGKMNSEIIFWDLFFINIWLKKWKFSPIPF